MTVHSSASTPTLTRIFMVTHTVPDLGAIERAYCGVLGYRLTARGRVDSDLAKGWGAPKAAGRPYILLSPASGEDVHLRFVEQPATPGYRTLFHYGWNATEILVTDPDALAEKLKNSPFEVVGPPRNLSNTDAVRAMQALGPAGELLYFTRVSPEYDGHPLGQAISEVDRVFICVVGGPDMDALRKFYLGLGQDVTPPVNVRVSVLSKAHGIDPETLHPLALAKLPGPFVLELDHYPATAGPRPGGDGDLPPGMAMVSFRASRLDPLPAPAQGGIYRHRGFPYGGAPALTLRGPAGEWLELVGA